MALAFVFFRSVLRAYSSMDRGTEKDGLGVFSVLVFCVEDFEEGGEMDEIVVWGFGVWGVHIHSYSSLRPFYSAVARGMRDARGEGRNTTITTLSIFCLLHVYQPCCADAPATNRPQSQDSPWCLKERNAK